MKPSLAQRAGGTVHVLGRSAPWGVADDDSPVGCCMGEAMRGPTGCTCWEPIYDAPQAEPDTSLQPSTRSRCCFDCAYRNGSPERADEYEEEALRGLPERGGVFWCHQGLRRAVAYRHPSTGRVLPAGPGDYRPLEVDGVPYQANGTTGERCAGWAAFAGAQA